MKILNIILRIVLCLLLATPILGALGVFPAPTADLYNTPQAFAFINTLGETGYLVQFIASVFAIAIVLVVTNRMALAALLILPVSLNILAFHFFLDGGLMTSGALLADALVLINFYFLWRNRAQYRGLLEKSW